MTRRVRLHSAADEELNAAAQWYEDQRADLGEQFLAAALESLHEIERHPERFSRTRDQSKREIRKSTLDRFPYSIVYEVRDKDCYVIAVAHASRSPNYWRDRV